MKKEETTASLHQRTGGDSTRATDKKRLSWQAGEAEIQLLSDDGENQTSNEKIPVPKRKAKGPKRIVVGTMTKLIRHSSRSRLAMTASNPEQQTSPRSKNSASPKEPTNKKQSNDNEAIITQEPNEHEDHPRGRKAQRSSGIRRSKVDSSSDEIALRKAPVGKEREKKRDHKKEHDEKREEDIGDKTEHKAATKKQKSREKVHASIIKESKEKEEIRKHEGPSSEERVDNHASNQNELSPNTTAREKKGKKEFESRKVRKKQLWKIDESSLKMGRSIGIGGSAVVHEAYATIQSSSSLRNLG